MSGDGPTGDPSQAARGAPSEHGGLREDPVPIGMLASRPVKRSFSIAGHRTSISLEAAFWEAFRELCRDDGIAMAAMLARIDRERGNSSGLSSAVRVWVLQRYRAQCVAPLRATVVNDQSSNQFES